MQPGRRLGHHGAIDLAEGPGLSANTAQWRAATVKSCTSVLVGKTWLDWLGRPDSDVDAAEGNDAPHVGPLMRLWGPMTS